MVLLKQAFKIWFAGKALSASSDEFLQLMKSMMVIAIMTIVMVIIALALIGSGFYFAYMKLAQIGFAPGTVFSLGVIILLCALVVLSWLLSSRINDLRYNMQKVQKGQSPLAHRISGITNAFMNGLLSPRK